MRYKPPLSADEIHALYLKYGLQDMSAQTDASGRTQKKGGAELATVWKRHADNSLEPVELTPGITDHAFTQVKSMVKGGLAPGDEVVTGSLAAGASAQGGPPARR